MVSISRGSSHSMRAESDGRDVSHAFSPAVAMIVPEANTTSARSDRPTMTAAMIR
jgi:hypothetical protein